MCLNLPTKEMNETEAKSTLTDAKRALARH